MQEVLKHKRSEALEKIEAHEAAAECDASFSAPKKASKVYTDTYYSRLFFARPNWPHVRSKLVPCLTHDRLIEKNICTLANTMAEFFKA